MMNTNKLPNPELMYKLYQMYYIEDRTPSDLASSHWKKYAPLIKVKLADDGFLNLFKGCGFGDLQNGRILNKVLNYFCNASYFIRLSNKQRIRVLSSQANILLREIDSYVSYDCFRQICALSTMENFLNVNHNESFHVLIIGDGYGFLSGLIKKVYPLAKITLVDLGKVLFFQAVNLQRMHNNFKHVFISDSDYVNNSFDFLYVPAEKLEEIKELKYKFFINIASMQEMNNGTIKRYFDFMRSRAVKDNLFYCCNREKKILPGGEITEIANYPWTGGDKFMIDSDCPFYRYFFSLRPPFFKKFDGKIIHRLATLEQTEM